MPGDIRPYMGPPKVVTITINDKHAINPEVTPKTLQLEMREFDRNHDWNLLNRLSGTFRKNKIVPLFVVRGRSYDCRGPHLFFLSPSTRPSIYSLHSSAENNMLDPEFGGWMVAALFLIANYPEHKVSQNMMGWLHHYGVAPEAHEDQFLLTIPEDWWNVQTVKEVNIFSGGV